MAYSNWGAFVYANNLRRTDREDVAVFDDDGCLDGQPLPSWLRIYANILRNRDRYGWNGAPAHDQCFHAVLGDGDIRLACYKTDPLVFDRANAGRVTCVRLTDLITGEPANGVFAGAYHGCRFRLLHTDNRIDLGWVETDGKHWHARCGYLYGAGHTDIESGPSKASHLHEIFPSPS